MNRILLFLLLFCAGFAGCKNTNDVPAEIRAQLVVDNKIIGDYLQKQSLTTLSVDSAGIPTGIRYVIDKQGTGVDLYSSASTITVGFTGTLLTTGTQFITTDEFHPSYVLGSTIRGWQLGVPKVKKGGTIRLFIPSHYAYGPFAQPTLGLPANSILIFTITVYDIKN